MDFEADGRLMDIVLPYLEERGWESALGAGSRMVEHTFSNDHGTLLVDFLRASPASVGFLFETDTKQARFLIFFDDVLPIMETICSAQDHLSEDTWPSFVEELLRRSTRIVWIAQDEDDEDFDITTVEEGRAALRETFWEYLDDDET